MSTRKPATPSAPAVATASARTPSSTARGNDGAGVVPRIARQAASTPVPTAAPASSSGHWVATAPTATHAERLPAGHARPPLRTASPRASRTPRNEATDCSTRASRSTWRSTTSEPDAATTPSSHRARSTVTVRGPLRGGGGCSSPTDTEPARAGRARAGCSAARSRRGGSALRRPGTLSTLGTPGRLPVPVALEPPVGQRGVGTTYGAHGLAVDDGVQRDRVVLARLHDDLAVRRDHQEVAGVARTGLSGRDDPDRVLDRP